MPHAGCGGHGILPRQLPAHSCPINLDRPSNRVRLSSRGARTKQTHQISWPRSRLRGPFRSMFYRRPGSQQLALQPGGAAALCDQHGFQDVLWPSSHPIRVRTATERQEPFGVLSHFPIQQGATMVQPGIAHHSLLLSRRLAALLLRALPYRPARRPPTGRRVGEKCARGQ